MPEKKLSPILENNVMFSVTVNPDDSGQFVHKNVLASARWASARRAFVQVLTPYRSYIHKLNLYPDLSAPSLGGGKYPRIHWHGIIEFKDVVKFMTQYEDGLSHYMIDLDTIENKDKWMKYCLKFIKRFSEYTMYSISMNDLGIDIQKGEKPLSIVEVIQKLKKEAKEASDESSNDSDGEGS